MKVARDKFAKDIECVTYIYLFIYLFILCFFVRWTTFSFSRNFIDNILNRSEHDLRSCEAT